MKPFPDHFTIVRPDTWSERQRGWQIRRPAAQSKLRKLCRRARAACFVPRAKSPNFLICCVLSIRVTLFGGRNLKLSLVSTQTALFVDSSRFRWREYGRQATRLANMPASRSKQATRATPKGSLRCFVPRAQSPHTIWFSPLPQTPESLR